MLKLNTLIHMFLAYGFRLFTAALCIDCLYCVLCIVTVYCVLAICTVKISISDFIIFIKK